MSKSRKKDTELDSFKIVTRDTPTTTAFHGQMRCLKCGKFFTFADGDPCYYHSGTWVEPNGRDGALCGWSCCRIEGRMGPSNIVTIINPNAMVKHSKGCKEAPSHTEDTQYSQIIANFPLQEQTVEKEEKGKSKETKEVVEEEKVRKELKITKDGQYYEHDVEEGDTLVGISLKYGVSTKDIKRANKLMDDKIFTRKVIFIPRSQATATPELFTRSDRNALIRAFKKKIRDTCTDAEAEYYLNEAKNDLDAAVQKFEQDVSWEKTQATKGRSSLKVTTSTIPSHSLEPEKPESDKQRDQLELLENHREGNSVCYILAQPEEVQSDVITVEMTVINPESGLEQRQLLPPPQNEVEPTSREKIKKVVVSGVGFFSDAYDLFIINIVMVIMSKQYHMTDGDRSMVSSAALVGAILGQVVFGFIADKIGRKKGFVLTLSLVVLGSLLSTASFQHKFITVFISLAVFRFILGIGIGGEYPLSATITSESSNASNRGRMVASVFSMQGLGSLCASLTGFILIQFLGTNYEWMWRLSLAIGAIPGLMSMYFRVTMHETGRFLKNTSQEKVSITASLREYGVRLLGTAGCWFLLDVTFYANGLFSAIVLEMLQKGSETTESREELLSVSKFNVVLALMALPGYWMGIFLIDLKFWGRRNTQMIGFLLLSSLYVVMAVTISRLQEIPQLFIILYGMTFFITNAGPNTTTFVLPSESFPTRIRATYHGISAASGKLGAALGALLMAPAHCTVCVWRSGNDRCHFDFLYCIGNQGKGP